jgi:hypothetical protein
VRCSRPATRRLCTASTLDDEVGGSTAPAVEHAPGAGYRRTVGKNGSRRRRRRGSTSTTFPARRWARPLASMTSLPARASWWSATMATLPSSRWPASAAGGIRSGSSPIPRPPGCSSLLGHQVPPVLAPLARHVGGGLLAGGQRSEIHDEGLARNGPWFGADAHRPVPRARPPHPAGARNGPVRPR